MCACERVFILDRALVCIAIHEQKTVDAFTHEKL